MELGRYIKLSIDSESLLLYRSANAILMLPKLLRIGVGFGILFWF